MSAKFLVRTASIYFREHSLNRFRGFAPPLEAFVNALRLLRSEIDALVLL